MPKLPIRDEFSHKDQNGIAGILGGNPDYHGAPILSALGAERSGVDLIHLFCPPKHEIVARSSSLNFIVHPFHEDYFQLVDLDSFAQILDTVESLVIGNGIGEEPETRKAIIKILENSHQTLILDAQALFPEILPHIQKKTGQEIILTPHLGEFERCFHVSSTPENLCAMARKYDCMICLKGKVDKLADKNGNYTENTTGHEGMTVGGTGDALAGIIGSFCAQGPKAFEACESALFFWGKCGEVCAQTQHNYSAQDMLNILPKVIKQYSQNS